MAPFAFNKPATMRRSDGAWANYTYQGSEVTGITITKTTTGTAKKSAPLCEKLVVFSATG